MTCQAALAGFSDFLAKPAKAAVAGNVVALKAGA